MSIFLNWIQTWSLKFEGVYICFGLVILARWVGFRFDCVASCASCVFLRDGFMISVGLVYWWYCCASLCFLLSCLKWSLKVPEMVRGCYRVNVCVYWFIMSIYSKILSCLCYADEWVVFILHYINLQGDDILFVFYGESIIFILHYLKLVWLSCCLC